MTFVYQFGSISEKHPILEMTYVYHFEYISDKITTKIRQKSNKNRQIKVIIVINRLINRLNNELINRQTNELTNILNNRFNKYKWIKSRFLKKKGRNCCVIA
jgi:ssRNA-specific RNase YbeY (16S rRNA maturation enzyme)